MSFTGPPLLGHRTEISWESPIPIRSAALARRADREPAALPTGPTRGRVKSDTLRRRVDVAEESLPRPRQTYGRSDRAPPQPRRKLGEGGTHRRPRARGRAHRARTARPP